MTLPRRSSIIVVMLAATMAPARAQNARYQQYAPIDLTGTWVSLVTEDWQYRMIAPAKGDFANFPLNAEAVRIANAWDPARDDAASACQAFAAPTIMREPGRVRISWTNGGNALRVETDAGQQTRTFHFTGATPPRGPAGWQGFSQATWEYAGRFDLDTVGSQPPPGRGRAAGGGGGRGGGRGGRGGRGDDAAAPSGGALKVVTTNLRSGYLRKNGVPFSEDAVVTEYFNVYRDPIDNATWMVVTTAVRDPKYLRTDYITSSNFRKESDDSGWSPRPCTLR